MPIRDCVHLRSSLFKLCFWGSCTGSFYFYQLRFQSTLMVAKLSFCCGFYISVSSSLLISYRVFPGTVINLILLVFSAPGTNTEEQYNFLSSQNFIYICLFLEHSFTSCLPLLALNTVVSCGPSLYLKNLDSRVAEPDASTCERSETSAAEPNL